jgi:hypothetical protein
VNTKTIEEQAAAEVAAMTPAPAPAGITEDQIQAKVSIGLTREQALQLLKRDANKTDFPQPLPEEETAPVPEQYNPGLLSREKLIDAKATLNPDLLPSEAEVKEKMAAGLSREQAFEIINNQRRHDAAIAAQEAAANQSREAAINHARETNH